MSSVSGGPAGSFTMQYDAKGRRENDTGANTGTNYYLDNGKTVTLANNVNGGNQTLSSYVTLPGSGEVVGFAELGGLAPQAPGNARPLVPLHDLNGSTLGIVYGSNNTLGTQWSYEPFGTPYQSGPAVSYPFLFEGMQLDPTGYYGDYSPRLAHSLSGGSTAYNGAGNSGVGGSARRMRAAARGNTAIANDAFCSYGDCAGGGQPQGSVSQDLNAFISSLQRLGNLLSQWLGGLFSGSQHPYKPSPSHFAPSHSLLAVKIGVPTSIAMTNEMPQYPTGQVQPISLRPVGQSHRASACYDTFRSDVKNCGIGFFGPGADLPTASLVYTCYAFGAETESAACTPLVLWEILEAGGFSACTYAAYSTFQSCSKSLK